MRMLPRLVAAASQNGALLLDQGSQMSRQAVLLLQGLSEGKLPAAGSPGKSPEWAGHACPGHKGLCPSAGCCAAAESGRGLQHCAIFPVCHTAIVRGGRQLHCCSSLGVHSKKQRCFLLCNTLLRCLVERGLHGLRQACAMRQMVCHIDVGEARIEGCQSMQA